MRKLAIGLAMVTVAAGAFAAPRVEAQPEGCAAAYPVPCEYVAHQSGGCALIGSIRIDIYSGSTLLETQNYTSSEPGTPCAGVGTDGATRRIVVTPLTPGTATFVGSDGGLVP